MLKIAVLVSGGGTNLQAILDAIDEGKITNASVELVISNNAGAYALTRAKEHGIQAECIAPKDYENREAFHQALLERLVQSEVDLIVLAGYLVAIPSCIVEAFPNRIINIHPSLIPSFCGVGYYGLRVHEGVLARGVRVTGATVHFVDAGTDTGPIILQKAVAVKADDTPKSLQQRVMEEAEWQILPKAIDLIANGCVSVTDGRVTILETDRSR
jgi:phosphoribosylglycinamide formyltransferase-1